MSIYDKLTGNKNDEYKPTSYNDEEAVTAVGPNWRVEQEPAEQPATVTEAPRLTDVYWTPQRILDEQQKRKDPNYVSPLQDVTTPEIDSVANYISSNREKDPTLWENGDPGWRADDAVWTSTVSQWKSPEETVPEVSAQSQTDAVQQGGVANVTAQDPTSKAEEEYGPTQVTPKGRTVTSTQSAIDIRNELVSNDSRFSALNIDRSDADTKNLRTSENIFYYGLPGIAGSDIKNQGIVEKATQPFITSLMSSGGTGKYAKLISGLAGSGKAGVIGFMVSLATFGYSYTKATGLHEGIPIVDKVIELTDWKDEKSQQFQGALAYGFEKAGGGDLTDPTKFFTNLSFFYNHLPEIINYAFGSNKASTEYDSDVVKLVTGLTANIGANAIGFGQTASRGIQNVLSALVDRDKAIYLEKNETTRANAGLTGKFTIPDEMVGSNAIIYWLDYAQELKNRGVTGSDLEYIINTDMASVYGDRFNLSEMFEHEFGDPDNAMENMQAREIGAYAKITGDKNLQAAAQANTGNFLMDAAGIIPGAQGAIETVGRLFGHEIRSSGGIDEVFTTWDMVNKTNPVDQLTAVDRRFSNIDEDGKIKGMVTPNENPNAVKNPFTKAKVALQNLFSPTNEYRAQWEGDQIFEYINVGIDDAMRARPGETTEQTIQRMRQFINELENPSTISEDSPFAKISQSAMFRTIQDDLALAVKNNKEAINKAIEDYGRLAENRQILQALSKALKLDPARVLDMYENKKTVLTQMIINEADKNGGKIEGIDIPVEGADFGKQVIQRISPFTGKNADAWDTRQLTVLLSSKIADGVTDTIINKYNIQPEPFLYRFGDMVKKMQNLVLLGLSPSYLANNLVNNVVTRSAIGYGGYMNGKQIKSFMDRFGFMPERLKESISGEIGQKSLNDQTNYDKLTEKIRGQRQHVEGSGFKKNLSDAMKKVGDAGSWASSTFGVFGNLSNKVESYESKQIVTSAMMTYLARTWKPGINFRKMPVALETKIREQNPGMVEAIYSAISSGINMTEIENAIYDTYVAPSVYDCLLTSAEKLNLDNADDIITEMFVKGGLKDELETALKNKRGDEVAKVVDEIAERLKQEMSVQYSEAVAKKAVEVGLGVTNEGFVAACEAGQAAADEMLEVWLNGQFENDQLFERRINENMTPEEFHKIYSAQQQRLTERWKNVYAMQQQTFLGILRGLGINEPNAKTYVDKMVQKNQLWVDFYEHDQPVLFQKYLDACKWSVDDKNKAQWAARVRKAWSQYRRESKKLVKTIQESEMKLQEEMDTAYLTGLKQALGEKKSKEVDQTLKPIFEAIRNKRKEIIALNDEFRAKANKTNSTTKKNNIWGGENADTRAQVKKDYHDLQERLYQAIGTFNPFVTSKPAQEASVPEVDQEGNIRIDAAEVKAEETEQLSNDYSEMVSDQIDKTGEAESKATTPEGWKVELAKNNLRQVAEKTGATHSLARAYATLVGEVLKNQWDSNHPGQDYFKEHDIEVRYTPEDRFVPENRYSPNIYFQTEQQGQPESLDNKNFYHQESESERRIKGQFSVEGVKKLIELFKGSDFGTLTHESGHWFTLTLNDSQIEALAAYNGWTPERYRQLENQWYNAPDTMSAEDYKAWVDAQERFAYGFEQYLLEGKAPNNAMRVIFEKFRKFLLELYKGVRHLVYNGEEIDIHKEQNHITLAAIFDSMLGESGELEAQLGQLRNEGDVSFGITINDGNRDYFQSESDKQWKKYNELKTQAEDKIRSDAAKYVMDNLDEWKLTNDEADELIVELMHGLGLNSELEESEYLKHALDQKTGNRQHIVNEFVVSHREDAVKISDDAIRKYMDEIAKLSGSQYDEHFEQWKMLYGYYQTDENGQIAQAKADKEAQEAQAEADRQRTLKQEQIQFDFDKGKAVPLNAIDLSEIKPAGELNAEVDKLAQTFYDLAQSDDTATDVVKKLTVDQWKDYIRQRTNSKGKPTITRTVAKQMDGAVQFWNKDNDYVGQVESLRTRRFQRGPVPQRGDFIVKTYVYENGAHQIVAQVIRNGKRVADVPSELPFKEVRNGSKVYKVLGVNPANPSLLVYQDGTEIRTAKMHTDTGTNAYAPEMEHRFTPATDPVAEAQNKEMYEKVLEILDDFKTTYAQAKDNAMTSKHYSDLSDDAKSQLRRYIDVDVRQDLANTKFKTTKFGEIMRDAALLNYSKRYGFDNFLTFICPYQFWMTRSFINWMNRMGSKGGRLWRRYARLKELERWNKKEYLPSKVSGKWGVYVPGLTEWMGNGAFMPTDQLGVVGNFFNPILDFAKNTKKNVIASAEEILRQDRADGTITQEEYSQALDPLQREKSGIWQSALARAQMQEDSDPNFGGLMEQYLGFSLPVSIGRALLENNPQGWNQWPMSRAGNAWRAVAGDNIIGKGGQYLLSLPERTARDIASKKFGSAFEYKEFGEFGDYYIRNQVYDMVVEGRIDPVDAVQAVAEKDGNAIWEEAADRQREEVLMAMQGGHALSAIKDTAQDIIKSNNGAEMNEHWLRDDLMNVFAGLLTAPLNKTVVREAESTWREQTGELNKAFASDDENAVNQFYDDNQNYEFKNLRYEADPEIALRQYLYKTITNLYYDMDKADQEIVKMSFGEDFENYVLNKETRAIESIDLSTLAGYAQALNGKVPFIATDKINTTKPQQFNMLEVSQAQKDAYNTYFEERERDWKGWADVNNIYWSLPVNQREAFLQANPRLDLYQQWNSEQRENKDLDSFLGMRSDYYAMREAGKAVSMMSEPLLRAVTVAASTDAKLDKDYQTAIEILMRNVGTTKSYDSFVKNLKIYILGE